MQYTIHGKTGLKVSRLGFGAMRLPMKAGNVDRDLAIPMIHRAFEKGVTYIDTAVGYCGGDSQVAVGEALKGWRDKVVVSTKNHHYNKSDDRPWWKNLSDSLQRLDVEVIDVYNFHGLNWRNFCNHLRGRDGQLTWMHKALDQGLIKHICCSFHDTPENLIKLAKTGEFEAITLQYNLIDQANEQAMKVASKLGLGITVMGPVSGGRLGTPSPTLQKLIPGAKTVPEVALRFVLANPTVTIALSGMSEMAHVEENVRTAGKRSPLSSVEKRRITSALNRFKKLSDLYCTGCNYCMPCPSGVDIPGNFTALNLQRVYDLPDVARKRYQFLSGKAAVCVACGRCLDKCPQHIKIIDQLRETVRALDTDYGKCLFTVTPTEVVRLSRRSGGVGLELKCRLACKNLSDTDAQPQVTFKPGRNITVSAAKAIKALGPFEQAAVNLSVKASGLKDGQPIRLGLTVGKGTEAVLPPDVLALAIAPKASRKSPATALKRAPQIKAAGHQGTPSAKALTANSAKARFAYDTDALIVQFDLTGTFHQPPNRSRSVPQSDHVMLLLDTSCARRLKVKAGTPPQTRLMIGCDPDKSGNVPVVGVPPSSVSATGKGTGKRRQLLVRIPWATLGAKPPTAGASLGMNFLVNVMPRTGQAAWQRTWTPEPAGHVLLA